MIQLNFGVCRVREKKVSTIFFFERLTLSLMENYGFYKIKKNHRSNFNETLHGVTLQSKEYLKRFKTMILYV